MNGRRINQYLVTSAVSLAAVLGGVAFAWPTPVLPKLHNHETNINITDEQISWLAAMSAPGFITGSLMTRFTAERFGKRTTILGSVLPVITGTIIVLSTSTAWGLFLARILWGIGTGMLGTVSSVYLAEIADKEIRGTVTAVNRFMFNFGTFLVMSIGSFVSYHTLSFMLLILPICYFIACFFIPETPYYYLKEGKVDAARKSLKKLSGTKDETALEERLSAMRSDVGKEMLRSGSIQELLTGKRYRKAMTIAIGLRLTQNMAGSTAIQRYLGRIAQDTGSDMNVSTVLIIFGAVKFFVGIFSSIIVDKIGRRPLLIYSYLSSGVTLALVGTYYLIQPINSMYTFIPFVGIILSNILATLGYDTLAFIIPAEIFPINVKSVAMTFLNIFGGLFIFLSVKGYQQMMNVAGLAGIFWFYAASAMSGAVFTYFVVPETKGKSLKEIQIELQGDIYDEAGKKFSKVVGSDDVGVTATELEELKRDDT